MDAQWPGSWEAFKHFEPPSFIASQPQALLKCRVDYDSMSNKNDTGQRANIVE
jgi:hypothetical protein